MKNFVAYAALAVALGAGVVWASPSPQQVVEERITEMKKLGANLKVASVTPTPVIASASLTEAIAFAESIPAHFPKGTGIGDAGVTKTRALQDIWTKPAEFKAAAEALVTALKAARDAVGDKAKLDAALSGVGKTCGGCHKIFRGPEIE